MLAPDRCSYHLSLLAVGFRQYCHSSRTAPGRAPSGSSPCPVPFGPETTLTEPSVLPSPATASGTPCMVPTESPTAPRLRCSSSSTAVAPVCPDVTYSHCQVACRKTRSVITVLEYLPLGLRAIDLQPVSPTRRSRRVSIFRCPPSLPAKSSALAAVGTMILFGAAPHNLSVCPRDTTNPLCCIVNPAMPVGFNVALDPHTPCSDPLIPFRSFQPWIACWMCRASSLRPTQPTGQRTSSHSPSPMTRRQLKVGWPVTVAMCTMAPLGLVTLEYGRLLSMPSAA